MPHRQRCIHHSYTYFRLTEPLPSLPCPYVVGHYGSRNPAWLSNSDFVIENKGYIACCLAGEGVMHAGGEQHRFGVGDTYACRWNDPGAWHQAAQTHNELRWVFMVFKGTTALEILDNMLQRYGPFYRLDVRSSLVYRLMTVSRQPAHDTALNASDGAALVWDLLRAVLHHAEQRTNVRPRVDRKSVV
mgnify:CR=1 FL=1